MNDLFTTRETSRAAAQAARGGAPAMRERVYEFIKSRGDYGATDEEIQRNLNLDGSSVRPRRGELATACRIVMTGKTRKTSRGRDAIIWRVK